MAADTINAVHSYRKGRLAARLKKCAMPAGALWIILCLSLMAAFNCALTLPKCLPYGCQPDETIFVDRALHMVLSGDLNPHWYGHPSATYVNSLAAAFYLYLASGKAPQSVFEGLHTQDFTAFVAPYIAALSPLYLVGRCLSSLLFVATIPVVFYIGKKAFSERAGVIGALFFSICPLAIMQAQNLRDDSCDALHMAVAVGAFLLLLEKPSLKRGMLAGAFTGLAIASKYPNAILLPLLAIAYLRCARKMRLEKSGNVSWISEALKIAAAGFMVSALAFLAAAPFFIADLNDTIFQVSKNQLRDIVLGADGLSPLGNFMFYIRSAIPRSLTTPEAVLAAAGMLLCLKNRTPQRLFLATFVCLSLVLISIPSLHWQRWIGFILPVLVVLAGYAIETACGMIAALIGLNRSQQCCFLAVTAALVALPNCERVITMQDLQLNHNTKLAARAWILANLPIGSKIMLDKDSAPLELSSCETGRAEKILINSSPQELANQGYRYFVTNGTRDNLCFADFARYPTQCIFYQKLFDCPMLKEFKLSRYATYIPWDRDPTPQIRIFELPRTLPGGKETTAK